MSSTFEEQAGRGQQQGENNAAARSTANEPPPTPPTPLGLNLANPQNVQAVIAGFQAAAAAQQGTGKDGANVMLTRDVIGPTYGKRGPTNSNPGEREDGPYGLLQKGSIDEVNENYRDYYSGGFVNNNNERINDAVLLAAGGDFELYEPIFQAAVNEAAVRQSSGERITVEEILQGWTKNGLPDGLKRGGGGGGGSRSFVNVDTRVDLTNEGEARRIVNNALTGALGREATKAESRAFMKALNMYEKENPTVTTSKGVSSAGGTTSTTTQEGGFDSIDFADRYAKSQEGYAEYQTATTYLDAFIGALESDSRVI